MDPAVAIIVGVLLGSLLTWVITLFQRQADREARAVDRKYERLHSASRLIRLSMWQAVQLNFSRTWVGMLISGTSFGQWTPNWQPLAYTIAEVGAALAMVLDDVDGKALDDYEAAVGAMLQAKHSDKRLLTTYVDTALVLRRELEAKARALR